MVSYLKYIVQLFKHIQNVSTTDFDSFMFAQVVPYRVAAREVVVPCYLLSPLLPHLLY